MNFIRTLMLVVVVTLLSTTLLAQDQFGIRQGVAATTFSAKGNLPDNSNVTFSYSAGAFYDIQLDKSFYLQPEFNYVRKGRNDETTELGISSATDFMVHYLQIPVLLQYRDTKSMEKSGSFFYVNGGPYVAFATGSQTRPSNAALVSGENSTDWGATFGIGYQTPFLKKGLRFDLRYDMGLSTIARQPSDYRTKALSLTVGIAL